MLMWTFTYPLEATSASYCHCILAFLLCANSISLLQYHFDAPEYFDVYCLIFHLLRIYIVLNLCHKCLASISVFED